MKIGSHDRRYASSCSLLVPAMLVASTSRAFAESEAIDELVGFAILLPILLGIYFVPSIVAFARAHPNRWPILVVNLVFGLTGVGWIGALIWALLAIDRPAGGGNGGAFGLSQFADDPRSAHPPYLPTPPYADLARLKELLDKGAIDQVEYDQLKHRLLFGSTAVTPLLRY